MSVSSSAASHSQSAAHDRRQRILFLAQRPPPVHGVTVVSDRVYRLLEANSDFVVEERWTGGAKSMADIGTKSVGKLFAFAGLCLDLMARGIRRQRVDRAYLTLTPWSHAAIRDGLVAWLAGWSADRVLVHLHTEGLAVVLADNGLRARTLRWLLRGTELIAITEETVTAARHADVFASVYHLPNTVVDPASQETQPDPATTGDKPAPFTTDAPLHCAYLGNFDSRKGIYTFVETLAALRDRGVPVKGTIAGGPSRFVTLDDVTKAIAEAGLSNQITLCGFVSEDEKAAILRMADLFIYPSRHDHAPLVLLEAMSFGVVPITLDAGGIRSMLGTDLSANVFDHTAAEPETVAALTERAAHYAANTDSLAIDGMLVRQHYLREFSERAFSERLTRLFAVPVTEVTTDVARAAPPTETSRA